MVSKGERLLQDVLDEDEFDFISASSRDFILAFDTEMKKLGYGSGGKIGNGFCWGRNMIVYTKTAVKSNKVFARIYIKDDGIVLRLFFSKIDKHRNFIENAPTLIKDVFVNDFGNCKHCKDDGDGLCKFRKSYTIEGRHIEKCNGTTFTFGDPSIDNIIDYIDLFTEFYPRKRSSRQSGCSERQAY